MPAPHDHGSRRPLALGAAVVALVAVAMTAWTWRMWADPLVDFGGEAYVAWRLSEGDVLYRDLAYFTGPLAPYLQATWMRVFGASLTTIAAVNLVQLAAVLAMLYALLRRIADDFGAACACAGFAVLGGLALHGGAGNYNFVWPYSQEMPLATALSLATLLVSGGWIEKPSKAKAILVGALFGLVFLTKLEFTLALGAALGSALLASDVQRRVKLSALAWASVSALVPGLISWALLAAAMPASDALLGVLGAWPHALAGDAGDFPLYRVAMGLDPLGHHLARIAAWAAGSAAAIAALQYVAQRLGTLAAALAGAGLAAAAVAALDLRDALYPLTFYTAGAAWLAWRTRRADASGALRVAWCVFACLLLVRMALNARLQFYGFALAAPGWTVVAIALASWLPSHAPAKRKALRAALVPLLAAVVVAHVAAMAEGRRWNTLEVGDGADRMVVNPRGQFLPEALAWIDERCPADGTLLVLPEGAMLDYLSRRRAPTRHFSFMPPEMAMYGEDEMLRALKASPPDAILLVHRDTSEYGVPHFGRDYGRAILAWVKSEYRATKLWSLAPSERPFEPGTRHAIAALERKR